MTQNRNQPETREQIKRKMSTAAMPLQSTETEEALLGCLLLDPDAIVHVAHLLNADDFFTVRFGWVYDAIVTLWRDQHQEPDRVTVLNLLRERGQLDELGGPAELTRLLNQAPHGMYAPTYAELLQRVSDRRRLQQLAASFGNLTIDESMNINAVYAEIMRQVIEAKPRALLKSLMTGGDVFERFLELQSRDDGDVKVFTLPFASADKALPFMTSGHLFAIGGDEKTGKSALAEVLSEHWAQNGKVGFYIHTEEKPDDKVLRRYSRWSGIPFLRLEASKLTSDELEQRTKAIEYCLPWAERLHLWHESLPTNTSIVTLIRRAVEVFGVDFVVIDNWTDVQFENIARGSSAAIEHLRLLQQVDDLTAQYNILTVITTQMTTQESGKRIAFGTSAFNKKCTWFWDINRKSLKGTLKYRTDGKVFTVEPGEFDPRVDIHVPASRYGRGVKIPVFADLRRFYWRDRSEVEIVDYVEADA